MPENEIRIIDQHPTKQPRFNLLTERRAIRLPVEKTAGKILVEYIASQKIEVIHDVVSGTWLVPSNVSKILVSDFSCTDLTNEVNADFVRNSGVRMFLKEIEGDGYFLYDYSTEQIDYFDGTEHWQLNNPSWVYAVLNRSYKPFARDKGLIIYPDLYSAHKAIERMTEGSSDKSIPLFYESPNIPINPECFSNN